MDHEVLNIIASDPRDWEIPWAGIGALLLGIGGVLSGAAALITAKRKGRDEAISAAVSRSDDDERSGIPGGNDIIRSERTTDPNGDD